MKEWIEAMEVAVVGAGRAGRALGRLARLAGHAIGPVVCRSRARAEEATAFIGGGRPGTEPEGAELTLLGVPDGAIGEVMRGLRMPPGGIAAHLCACYGAGILGDYHPSGAVHPLRSFADPARAVELFRGTACAVEGDPEAVERLEAFVRDIGGTPMRVRAGLKPLYHAGAVFASNYLVAILEAALRLFEKAGVERGEGLRALLPLAEGTLANARGVGIPEALSGPLERGDAETVRVHVGALREHAPELLGLYDALGRLAIETAVAKGSIGAGEASRLGEALGG